MNSPEFEIFLERRPFTDIVVTISTVNPDPMVAIYRAGFEPKDARCISIRPDQIPDLQLALMQISYSLRKDGRLK